MALQLHWGLLAGPISRSGKNLHINETTHIRRNEQDLTARPIGYKIRTRIGTWNVRTLAEPSRLAQACKEMADYRLDILGLSEVRWKGHGEMRTASGHHFIFSGNNNSHTNGVGIILTPGMKSALMEHRPISDRLLMARFKTKYRNITIFQCYAPTEVDDEEAKNAFYDELNAEILRAQKSDIKIIIGDMNAKVGTNNTNLRYIMGNQGLTSTRNNNGERLVDICAAHQLYIGGTKFPHRDIHKYTWQSPDGVTRNQIDHFLISRKFLGCLLDVKTIRGADIYSDHQLLIGIVKLRPMANYHKKETRNKFNVHRLQDPAVANTFSNHVCDALSQQNSNTWADIVNACENSARNILGCSKHHVKPWISDCSWNLIDERKRIKLKLQNPDGPSDLQPTRTDYKESNKKVKKSVRSDKRQYYDRIALEAEHASLRGNTRAVYSAVRQLSAEKMRTVANIKDANGSLLTNTEEQLRRWREFFEVPNQPVASSSVPTPLNRRSIGRDITTAAPSLSEVEVAISKLKNNKAAGPDNLPSELFKYSPAIARHLWPLISDAWDSGNIPLDWKEGIIVTIPKKGDLSECKNWRGITLLNTIQKIMAFIVLDRISPVVESCLRNEQAGFRKNKSCVDHINSLRIIVEQSSEWNSPLYLLFVDFERAFDTINRDSIWNCLRNIGTPEKIITIIHMLYQDAPNRARFKGIASEEFHIQRGVRQGCVLSPLLFLLVLDSVMVQTNSEAREGIQWHLNKRLHDLDYADDICLMSHSIGGIQEKINRLNYNSEKVGLKINLRKTKIMRVATTNISPISIDGNAIEDVTQFIYLGSVISKDGGADADVTSRINKARHAYAALGRVWRSSQISKKQKLRIFNTSVKSVLLYGCETWKVTHTLSSRLQVFLNKCLRRILKIFWPARISNEDLLQACDTVPISVEIKRRKWRWIGHTLRKNNTDIAKSCFQWNPQGYRNRGRPRITWRRSVEAELTAKRLTWPQIRSLALDRTRYRQFIASL